MAAVSESVNNLQELNLSGNDLSKVVCNCTCKHLPTLGNTWGKFIQVLFRWVASTWQAPSATWGCFISPQPTLLMTRCSWIVDLSFKHQTPRWKQSSLLWTKAGEFPLWVFVAANWLTCLFLSLFKDWSAFSKLTSALPSFLRVRWHSHTSQGRST